MPRYRHFLAAAKGSAHPSRVVGLALDTTAVPIPGDRVALSERMVRWHVAGWSRKGRDDELHWQTAGDTAAGFWDDVDYALRRGGATWLVAWNVLRCMSMLHLWEKLEDGELIIGGAPARRPPSDTGNDGHAVEAARRGVVGHASTGSPRRGAPLPCGAVIEDPPTILTVRRPGLPGSLVILDTRNWGFPDPARDEPADQQARRARDSVRFLSTLIRANGWGSMAMTAGGQAWKTWRTAYAQHPVQVHCHPVALELEGAAYYGGRCEARYIGRYPGHVWHVDYRSLYGWIAASCDLPALLCHTESPVRHGRPGEAATGHCRIAEVQLSTSEPAYPYRRDGETYWPVGTFWTALAGPELEDAYARGRVLRTGRTATYRLSPVLAGFANAVWRELVVRRASADERMAAALKRLLLCLPGRCGQRGSRWVPDPGRGAVKQWGEWSDYDTDRVSTRYRALAGAVEREERSPWAPEALPAVAAWITSAGRMALLSAIRQAGWRNVLYHDTDSLIVNEDGWQLLWLDRRILHDTFGALRLLCRAERCEIRGIKDYTLDGVRTCAGLPKGTIVQSGTPDYYWYGVHARGALQQQRRPEAELALKTYTRERGYHHGIVGTDGYVSPLEVRE